MTQYIARRLLLNLVVILIVMTFIFITLRILPGDFAAQQVSDQFFAGRGGDPEEALRLARERLGLHDSIPVQYGKFLRDLFTGDFGTSFRTGDSALTSVRAALPYTLQLGLMSVVIALILAFPVGIISALRQDSWLDGGLRLFAVFFLAAPPFWTATLGSGWSLQYDILELNVIAHPGIWEDPWGSFQLMIIPALAAGLAFGAILMRFLRSQLLDVLRQDYVRTARAKGLRSGAVITRHVLRNALIPIVTIFGISLAALVGGNVILETMFNIPGMGRLLLEALLIRDVPVAQSMALLLVVGVVMINLLVDLSYFLIDPRVTVGAASE